MLLLDRGQNPPHDRRDSIGSSIVAIAYTTAAPQGSIVVVASSATAATTANTGFQVDRGQREPRRYRRDRRSTEPRDALILADRLCVDVHVKFRVSFYGCHIVTLRKSIMS